MPRGLALEFHLLTIHGRSIGYWLFEDGRIAKLEAVGEA